MVLSINWLYKYILNGLAKTGKSNKFLAGRYMCRILNNEKIN